MSFYIVLEGIDGSGKTTQAARLAERLGALLVAEPTKSPIGTLIRERINAGELNPAVMVRLFAADRHDLVERVIGPALAEGRTVVSDRNLASSLVYQPEGDLTVDAVYDLNTKGSPLPVPDLLIVVRVSLGEATRRLQETRGHTDAFETTSALERHQGRYDVLGEFVRWPVVYVDGEADPDEVAKRVWLAVEEMLDH